MFFKGVGQPVRHLFIMLFFKMKNSLSALLISSLLFICACSKNNNNVTAPDTPASSWDKHIPFATSYNTYTLNLSESFQSVPEEKGRVELSEASGIAWSQKNPGMVWINNDSGNPTILFLVEAQSGEIAARYVIGGTSNLDWEDIEVSKGPVDGESYIYIADTGDNDEKRSDYSIYRIAEPKYNPATDRGKIITLNDIQVDRIQFRYPDGVHDNEALMVDPLTRDIYMVTKTGIVSGLYVLPYPQKIGIPYRAVKAGDFSFRLTSAATCSFDGKMVLIKNRQEIFYWQRASNESMVNMLARTPEKAPYAGEPQGEAVCFDNEYNYYTISEKASAIDFPMLYRYKYKK